LQPTSFPAIALGLAALSVLAGCGRQAGPAARAAAETDAGESGYVAPPEVLRLGAAPGGRIELFGSASPRARVRLATPGGETELAVADAGGAWRATAPAAARARLFGLSVWDHGRVIQAKGYLFLAPDGTAARLRAGGGSEVLGGRGSGLAATALDCDEAGAATLSGRAAPGDAVSLRVDGIERGRASADASGHFVLVLNQPLAAGRHEFDLAGARGEIRLDASTRRPAPLARAPFQATRTALGWRIDWLTPGGGEQTTLVLAPQASAP